MKIPKNARVIIIEGIAGSGKTTILELLRNHFKHKKLYVYSEEELLLGWKHIHIPSVSDLRFEFLNKFLDYVEDKLKKEKDIIFVLERFHITMKILEWQYERGFEKKYSALLSRVKKLPVHVIIPTLNHFQIKERSAHKERDSQWAEYIKEKLVIRDYPDLEALYIEEQKKVLRLAKQQKISYSTMKIDL